MRLIAVDPGVKGAFAVFSGNILRSVHDIPTFELDRYTGTGKRAKLHKETHYRYAQIHKELKRQAAMAKKKSQRFIVVFESTSPLPNQSVMSTAKQVIGQELWVIIGQLLGASVRRVSGLDWKGSCELSSEKELSIAVCKELYGSRMPDNTKLTHDRAEAILLGHFALTEESYLD